MSHAKSEALGVWESIGVIWRLSWRKLLKIVLLGCANAQLIGSAVFPFMYPLSARMSDFLQSAALLYIAAALWEWRANDAAREAVGR